MSKVIRRKDIITHDKDGRKVYLPALPTLDTQAQRIHRKALAIMAEEEAQRQAQALEHAKPVEGLYQALQAEKAQALHMPLAYCDASPAYWEALYKYVRAAVSRKLYAHARQDTYLQADSTAGPVTADNSPNTMALVGYYHKPRQEDIEDITQEAIAKALEHWQDWAEKVTEALEETEQALGIHMARYIARRAIYLHWQAQAKLQRQGLLGPDFWATVPETRTESDISLLINRLAWEETTDSQCVELLQYLEQGYTHAESCQALGVTPKTGRRWLNALAQELQGPAWEVYPKAPSWAVVSAGPGGRPIVTTQAKAQARRQAQNSR